MEKRAYNWRLVSYCNENEIIEFCRKWGSKWEYIKHDKDIDEEGNPKEVHFHINITLREWKSRNKVCELVGKSGNTFAIEMLNKEIAHRYLTHMDNPEKYQYDEENIKSNFVWKEKNKEKVSTEEFLNIIADKKLTMREKAIILGKDYIRYNKNYDDYVERMLWEEMNEGSKVKRVVEEIKAKCIKGEDLKVVLSNILVKLEEEEQIKISMFETTDEAPEFNDITTTKAKHSRPE